MIAYKAGVRVKKRTMALDHLENAALATQKELGYPKVLVVTSINDGDHSKTPWSRHYTNEAEDFRTKNKSASGTSLMGDMGSIARKQRFVERFQEHAGPRFYVAIHKRGTPKEHIHGQVRKGHVFP